MGFLLTASQRVEVDSVSNVIFEENEKPTLSSYSAWLEKHPSALDAFDRMMEAAKEKEIAVFLDYDGTLSPIVDDPDRAFVSDMMRTAVEEVSHFFPTAIVSGRSRKKVHGFVKLGNIYYAGSHGMDIQTPSSSFKYEEHKGLNRAVDEKGNEVIHFQPAEDFLPVIQEIIEQLNKKIKIISGAMVEDNKFCISVHFRRVKEEDVDTLQAMVKSTMEAYPEFRISGGKKVMEIRPRIDWDKGRALEYLLETFGFDTSTNIFPIYVGDDRTDEDAFKVIRKMERGYSIVVSSVPKETDASYSLQNTDEVMSFLLRLAKWKRKTLFSAK